MKKMENPEKMEEFFKNFFFTFLAITSYVFYKKVVFPADLKPSNSDGFRTSSSDFLARSKPVLRTIQLVAKIVPKYADFRWLYANNRNLVIPKIVKKREFFEICRRFFVLRQNIVFIIIFTNKKDWNIKNSLVTTLLDQGVTLCVFF